MKAQLIDIGDRDQFVYLIPEHEMVDYETESAGDGFDYNDDGLDATVPLEERLSVWQLDSLIEMLESDARYIMPRLAPKNSLDGRR